MCSLAERPPPRGGESPEAHRAATAGEHHGLPEVSGGKAEGFAALGSGSGLLFEVEAFGRANSPRPYRLIVVVIVVFRRAIELFAAFVNHPQPDFAQIEKLGKHVLPHR